jgi:hypothetical protein
LAFAHLKDWELRINRGVAISSREERGVPSGVDNWRHDAGRSPSLGDERPVHIEAVFERRKWTSGAGSNGLSYESPGRA